MSIYENVLKTIADEKRLKLIALLIKSGGEFYVCELAYAMEESQYNLSKYLKELKTYEFVKERRVGRGILYQIGQVEDEFTKKIFEAIKTIPDDYTKRSQVLLEKIVSMRENGQCVNVIRNPDLINTGNKTKEN